MSMEERKKERYNFLRSLYDSYYNENCMGEIVDVSSKESREKELIYQPLVDEGFIKVESYGMGKRKYTITSKGVFKIEEVSEEKKPVVERLARSITKLSKGNCSSVVSTIVFAEILIEKGIITKEECDKKFKEVENREDIKKMKKEIESSVLK